MASIRQKSPVAEQDLHAFVDGELDGEGYRAVIAHLAASPDATERVSSLLHQQGKLAALREQLTDLEPLPDERTEVLVQSLAGALRHQRRVRRHLVSSASGLALTLVVGLWSLWGPSPRLVSEHLPWPSSLSSDRPQVLFGRDPYSVAPQPVVSDSSESTFVWLDQQLAANSMQRPDFSAYGLRFVGGNALQSGDTPAVRLIYEDEAGAQVFLFAGSVGGSGDVALTLVPEGHLSLSWRHGSLIFALIGPKESEQLLAAMRDTGEFLMPSPGLMPETAADTAGPVLPESVVRHAVMPPSSDGAAMVDGSGGAEALPSPLPVSPKGLSENKPKSL